LGFLRNFPSVCGWLSRDASSPSPQQSLLRWSRCGAAIESVTLGAVPKIRKHHCKAATFKFLPFVDIHPYRPIFLSIALNPSVDGSQAPEPMLARRWPDFATRIFHPNITSSMESPHKTWARITLPMRKVSLRQTQKKIPMMHRPILRILAGMRRCSLHGLDWATVLSCSSFMLHFLVFNVVTLNWFGLLAARNRQIDRST